MLLLCVLLPLRSWAAEKSARPAAGDVWEEESGRQIQGFFSGLLRQFGLASAGDEEESGREIRGFLSDLFRKFGLASAGDEQAVASRASRAQVLEAETAPVSVIVGGVVVAVGLVAVVVAVLLRRRRGQADAGDEWAPE
jgi:hypothetical protein